MGRPEASSAPPAPPLAAATGPAFAITGPAFATFSAAPAASRTRTSPAATPSTESAFHGAG